MIAPSYAMPALQASCTKEVQKSIINVLSMKESLVLRSSFNRPNIEYQVGQHVQHHTCCRYAG